MEAPPTGSRLADRLAQLNSVNNNVSKLRERRLALQSKPKSTDYDILLPMVRASKKQDQVDGPWKKELETTIEGGRNVNFVNEATGKTILHDACAECSIEVVAFLLRSGADPSIVTRQHRSTLYYAALNKDPRVAERILAFSGDPHARMIERDNQQMTPFDMACLNANGTTAEWLYSQYPKKELDKSRKLDPTHRTALHLLLTGSTATEARLKELNNFIKTILKVRPSFIWRRDEEGRTPLAVHIQNHFKDATLSTFDVVLSSLASPQEVDTALYMLSNLKWKQKGPYNPEKWLFLQQLCADPQFAKFMPAAIPHVSDRALFAQDPTGRSILHWFALYGHTASFVEQLVDLYRDYDSPDKHWRHPLGLEMPPPTQYGSKVSFYNSCCWSALLRRETIGSAVEKIRGAAFSANSSDSPLRIVDNNQDTPLHIAAKFNNTTAVETLESMFPGEGKTWKDAKGRNALHVAAAHDSGAVIASLVHNVKCDIEERDGAGYTPLMIALRDKRDISVGVLSQLKAISQGISSTDGTTVEHLLEEYDQHAAEERKKKEEKRRAALAREEEAEETEEDEPDVVVKSDSPAADSDANDDETGSVEYHGSDNGSVNSMEEHDSGDEIASPVANGKFRPTIKRDSDYDDEDASKGDESPIKSVTFNGGATRPTNGRVLARNPRVKLTPTDDYSHSSDEDETGSTGSVEIHSDSPPASPRSETSLPSPRSESSIKVEEPDSPQSSPEGSRTPTPAENGPHSSELEQRVRDLEAALKLKEAQAEQLISVKESTAAQIDQLTKSLDSASAKVASYEAEISQSAEKLRKLEEHSEQTEAKLEESSKTLDRERLVFKDLSSALQFAQAEAQKRQIALESMQSELETAQKQNAELRSSSLASAQSSSDQLGEIEKSRQDAMKQVTELESRLHHAKAEHAATANDLEVSQQQQSALKQQVETLQSHTSTDVEIYSDLNRQILALQSHSTEAQEKAAQSVAAEQSALAGLCTLQAEYDAAIKQSSELEGQLKQLKTSQQHSSFLLSQAAVEQGELKSQISQLNNTLMKTESHLGAREAELVNEAEELKSAVSKLESSVADLTAKLTDVTQSSEQLKSRLEEQITESDALKALIDEQHARSRKQSTDLTLNQSQQARSQAQRNVHKSYEPSSSWSLASVITLLFLILAAVVSFLAIFGYEPQPTFHLS